MDPAHLNKLFRISNWLFLIPCYCQNSIGDLWNTLVPTESTLGLLSMIEPTKVDEALADDGWILAMQDELNQFKRNDVWDLVPKPEQKNIIGTKWVFRNKLNEQGKVIRNRTDLLLNGTANKKALIILKLFLQLQDWKQSGYFFPTLKVHFSLMSSLKKCLWNNHLVFRI